MKWLLCRYYFNIPTTYEMLQHSCNLDAQAVCNIKLGTAGGELREGNWERESGGENDNIYCMLQTECGVFAMELQKHCVVV
uniref:Uncharacterized protein n=1 Tax=Arion vulgaris TaxID=1028688 RepID=A0A0B7BYN9_9EUPU